MTILGDRSIALILDVGLAEHLGWTPSVLHSRSCIPVVNIAKRQVGLLVDEVADIVSISDDDVQPAPAVEDVDENIIAGLVQVSARGKDGASAASEGTMVLLFNLESLSVIRLLDETAPVWR